MKQIDAKKKALEISYLQHTGSRLVIKCIYLVIMSTVTSHAHTYRHRLRKVVKHHLHVYYDGCDTITSQVEGASSQSLTTLMSNTVYITPSLTPGPN